MPWCEKCRDYVFNNEHICSPQWKVFFPEFDPKLEDDYLVYARDAEEAAIKACNEYDCYGEYMIIKNCGTDVVVETIDGLKKFRVGAESIPTYFIEKGPENFSLD